MKHASYNAAFFENISGPSVASARQMLMPILQWIRPASLLELGCGTGAWTMAARELGVTDCIAVDGDWIRNNDLLIPEAILRRHDFEQPFVIDRKFDLALSLEVSEHLKPSAADGFVTSLTSYTDVALFGAALKFQGGTNHINEQWPNYWIEKFRQRGFECFDVVRPLFWNNADVAFYYKQNTYIFVRDHDRTSEIRRILNNVHNDVYRNSSDLCFIHPEKWSRIASYDDVNFDALMPRLPYLLFILLPRIARRRLFGKIKAILGIN